MAEFRDDLYRRALLRDPYPYYKIIRDMGPAVYMPKRDMWAVGRYDDVREVLRASDVFISGKGVGANGLVNGVSSPITLTSDDDTHDRRRRVLIQPVMPKPLKDLTPRLEGEADALVARHATGETFDAMASVAAHLPVTVVAELVGLNEAGRKRMLSWAAATFDMLGVLNLRGLVALPKLLHLSRYVERLSRSDVVPGGWADGLFEAAERGELSAAEARAMVIDYVGPALDTTILASGHMLWRLATEKGAYEAVRADPALVPGIVNEAVRLASPIRGFTRYAMAEHDLGGTTIPKGARVLVLFASANSDERHYEEPERFDVRRNPRDHVGWGHGPHSCVGMHLARLEMELLLKSLVAQVAVLEAGEPLFAYNNVLQGFRKLPMRFRAAGTRAAA